MMPPMRLIRLGGFPRRSVLERVAITTGLINFFVVGYFGVGLSRNSANAHILTTTLDDQIPFIAGSVWAYFWVLSCGLLPLFVVRCSRLFRRTAIAYAIVITVSLVFFVVFPVTSIQLRVPQDEVRRLALFRLGCFPSLFRRSAVQPFPFPPPLDRNSRGAFRVEGAQVLWSSSFSKRGVCRCVRLHTQTTLSHRCTWWARTRSVCRGAYTRSLQAIGARHPRLPMVCNSNVSRVSGCSRIGSKRS
jgi:hypothetical protein